MRGGTIDPPTQGDTSINYIMPNRYVYVIKRKARGQALYDVIRIVLSNLCHRRMQLHDLGVAKTAFLQ